MEFFAPLIFLVVSLVIAIIGGLIYLLYIPIKRKLLRNGKLTKYRSKQINISYILILVLISTYQTFDAFFPSQSFYEGEFKTVTLRDIPRSAEFIKKNSSYPDFHGEYCSSSQIKLSKEDYKKLAAELILDKRFIRNGEAIGSAEFDKSLGDKNSKNIALNFIRPIEGQEDHYFFIGFYDDNETVFVSICVT
jgi:hypothetical protein